MWLKVILGVFTTISAAKVQAPVESTVKVLDTTNHLLLYSTNPNGYVDQTQHVELQNYNEKRPSNPKKPDLTAYFQEFKWLPATTKREPNYTPLGTVRKGKKRETDVDDDFVPTQLLSQTRKLDVETYQPVQSEDPRLREVIKDTKIHVEYTEDGYEDIGYDHAGEERHLENDQDKEWETNNPKYGQLRVDVEKEFENYENVDPDEEEQEPSKSKRFANDIPKIQIDDYLVRVEPTTTVAPSTHRYPYYKIKNLDKNSALRYAESAKNIPRKVAGELSFYKHTGASKCDKIPLDINPVPRNGKAASLVKGPRLKDLGGKITCLKNKYFGENPLDNPLFAETNIETPQPIFQELRQKRSLTAESQVVKKNDLEEQLPEPEPLRLRIRRRKYPGTLPRPIFRGNPYVPTPIPPLLIFPSTVLPKYKTISEVYYKEEIQPSEQLNVFADVMNNIKKIKTDLVPADTEIVEDAVIPENQKPEVKMRKPFKRIKIRQSNRIPESSTSKTTTTTPTERTKTRRRNNHKNHKPDPQVYEEYLNTIKDKEVKLKKQPATLELAESELEDVLGLSPPVEFSTISVPVLSQKFLLNTFPVTGMRPPLSFYQPSFYNFVNSKPPGRYRFKNNFHVLHKRSLQPVYSEIRRDKAQPAQNDGDDYVPKRNRNFHYDPVRKQVVYTNHPKRDEEEEYEEVTEKEAEVATVPTTTTTTTTESGPSFLDYVQQLKTHKQYQVIPEPTEKPKNATTTEKPVTASSNPPEFLKFVSKLKNDDSYVAIPEKTTKPPKIEEKEDDFVDLKIFDVTEYLPTQENYVPAVTIDYSKYKTIERKPTNYISSKYNSEEVRIEETTTTTTEAALTTTRRIRSRTRRRPVTPKSTESTSTTTLSSRTRRRFRSTTSAPAQTSPTPDTQRPLRRRLPTRSIKPTQKVPSNHKEVYTPIEALDSPSKESSAIHSRRTVKSRLLQSKTGTTTTLPENVEESTPQAMALKSEEPKVTIIKDPSKRLYYYAPVK